MFSAEEYLLGWLLYLSAVAGLLTVCWRITRNVLSRYHIRQLVRLSVAILLLSPYLVNNESHYLAPAWAMAAMDMLFSDGMAFWRAGGPLLVIWCITLFLYGLLTLIYRILKKLSSHA